MLWAISKYDLRIFDLSLTMYKRKRAFTLIELLVVIALIGVLVGGIGFAMLGGGGGGIQNTERVLQGILLSARTEASSASGTATFPALVPGRNASSLLLINNDSGDLENYLREMHIVTWGTDVVGNDGWMSFRGASYLPAGVYVHPTESAEPDGSNALSDLMISLDTPSAEAQSAEGGRNWLYIPYDDRGRLNEMSEYEVVIAEGDPTIGTPDSKFAAGAPRGGYLVLNTGSVVRFPSEEAISN